MRSQFIMVALLAGTVAGCASSSPSPAPMAAEPPPPPPPMAMGPVDGLYKGMATLADGAPRACAKMSRAQTVRVAKNGFVLGGLKGMIGPDGAITAPTRRNMSLSGSASNGGLDLTSVRGKCSYHYALTKA